MRAQHALKTCRIREGARGGRGGGPRCVARDGHSRESGVPLTIPWTRRTTMTTRRRTALALILERRHRALRRPVDAVAGRGQDARQLGRRKVLRHRVRLCQLSGNLVHEIIVTKLLRTQVGQRCLAVRRAPSRGQIQRLLLIQRPAVKAVRFLRNVVVHLAETPDIRFKLFHEIDRMRAGTQRLCLALRCTDTGERGRETEEEQFHIAQLSPSASGSSSGQLTVVHNQEICKESSG